jgi:hypothetical protein
MARRPSAKPTKGSNEANGGQYTIPRNVLPVPDVTPIALTTFDARDPDTKYPRSVKSVRRKAPSGNRCVYARGT